MPKQTIYIRDEDMTLWTNLEHKSEWIHQHLNSKEIKIVKGYPIVVTPPKRAASQVAEVTYEKDCPRHHVPKSDCAAQHV